MNRRIVARIVRKAAFGALAGTLALHAFLFWQERSRIAKGYPDFTIFYSAGLMIRQGLAHRLYNAAAQYRAQRSFAPKVEIRQGPLPYNHPPFEALMFVPLSFLPYLAGYAIWNLLNLGMLAFIPRLLRPYIPILRQERLVLWVLGMLAFFPFFFALLQGQDVILLLLLQALAFAALHRDADFLAGCWLGLGSFKFHLVLPLVLILSAWKRPKIFLGFAATCLCLAGVSVAVVGWAQAMRYPEYVLHLEGAGSGALVPDMPNLRGLLEGWRMAVGLLPQVRLTVLALTLALLLWVILSSRRHLGQPMDLRFALAATASVLVSYHALASDLGLLAIPLLITFNYLASKESWRPRNPMLLLPAGLLLLTPLYLLLAFRLDHLNLLALVLLLLLWGIQRAITTESQWRRGEQDRAEAASPG